MVISTSTLPSAIRSSGINSNAAESPNHALQRPAPPSLSLGSLSLWSLGASRIMRSTITAIFLLVCTAVRADSPAEPVPKVTVANSGRCIFKLLPPHWNDKGKITRKPFGIAYELQDSGSFRELWRVEGWYAFRTFLSSDGRYLVRMGDWAVGSEPSKEDLAVAFYDRGKLLAQFSTADLVKDKTKVVASVSHYMWLAHEVALFGPDRDKKVRQPVPELDYDNNFHLKTCDGIEYTFDITTGKIRETKRA